MPASSKLLLLSRVLRREQRSEKQRVGRPPGARLSHGPKAKGPLEGFSPSAQFSARRLYPSFVPSSLEEETYPQTADGLWTRYGRWNAAGTKVYSGGKVIYERT